MPPKIKIINDHECMRMCKHECAGIIIRRDHWSYKGLLTLKNEQHIASIVDRLVITVTVLLGVVPITTAFLNRMVYYLKQSYHCS